MPQPWQPAATLAVLAARARLLARIRAFFADAGVMEVETPIASRAAATDPALESLATVCPGLADSRLWLHTSPELAMKRLLAAGAGPIYQICKVFRGGERGRRHHPEFTLLEWYRPGWDYRRLLVEVAALVRVALDRPELAAEVLTYRAVFLDRLGLDPMGADIETLRDAARGSGIAGAADLALDVDGWLDLLLTHRIESGLGRGRLTFLCDYPPSQAALARIRAGDPPVAERFELYLEGMELANGFTELTDAAEQRRRFRCDLQRRADAGLACPPIDEALLAALEAGLPPSAGVALGVDRLLMIATGSLHIDQVLAFPVERA
ncbi:MAG: EF-P lysine aminoacylase EpmA [Chromatiaceae bacterium]|nr:EF-P lysine aminoacylase EpmA [Chromatiaceae bacterium]